MSDEQKLAHSMKMKANWAARKATTVPVVSEPTPQNLNPPSIPILDNPDDPKNPLAPVKPPSGDRRLFQKNPQRKMWLTKEEAKAHGFYWNDRPALAGVDKSLVRGVRESQAVV
jgi:hypothetical protein